jgi:hypothetical protein
LVILLIRSTIPRNEITKSYWKILEGISPNCGIEETFSDRRGRAVKVPPVKDKGAVQSAVWLA